MNEQDNKPVSSIIQDKINKLNTLRENGVNPYPYSFDKRHDAQELQDNYETYILNNEPVSLAGRIMGKRVIGKASFFHVQDLSGKIQLFFAQDEIGKDNYKLLKKHIEVGDFIGVQGTLFETRTGEKTIRVNSYDLLTKAIRPLPEKYHGLKDKELRYRQRCLDLIVNPESRNVFLKRSQAIVAMREFLNSKGFVELEIPTLQPVYGGASARPFKTTVNALNKDYYLSISPELYLKRLIVGGFEKVYTICKNFRNEGIDRTHNPEFTMMECYWAYVDYNDMMKLTEEMYAYIFNKVNGSTKIKYGDVELDFTPPWKRVKMFDAIKQYTKIDIAKISEQELKHSIKDLGMTDDFYQSWAKYEIIEELFGKFVEPNLIQPTFIIDHPKESTPLCKQHREDNTLVERFEPFVYGFEIGNAYSELNDPILQRKLLEEQSELGRAGNEEAHQMDEDFCRAMEYGMPPTGGLGLGIDRLVMFLTNSYSIRDVILWPFMK